MSAGRTARVLVAMLAASSAAAQTYKLVPLHTSSTPLGSGKAYGLNNAGQIVGWSHSGENHQSTVWTSGDQTNLHGTVHLELLQVFNVPYSEAYDISDDDQIVGTARLDVQCTPENIVHSQAFVFRPAVLTDLATPYPGDALTRLGTFGQLCQEFDSAATAISNRSHIVGWAEDTGGSIYAFIVTPSQGKWFIDANTDEVNDLMVNLGTLDNASTVSSASSVNDSGQVTGYSYTTTFTYNGDSAYHAFLVTPQAGNWFVDANTDGINDLMLSLGTLGGPNSWGRDVNNNGEVVGEADTAEYYTHAFLYKNGQIGDLGTLGGKNSSAAAINDHGDIVGWAEKPDGQRRAFLYRNGTMIDLNDVILFTDKGTMTLVEARDINNNGIISGFGLALRGTSYVETAFMLRVPTSAELAASQAVETASGGLVSGTTTSGGTTGDGGAFGVTINGTPNTLGAPSADDPATADGSVDGGATLGVCGAGYVTALPLTLIGLIGLRAARRR